ncbi:MAG: hypothetical protein ACYTEZ_17855 [Planctomycetota bacterium]|jgi:hypothetical protein
MWARIRSLLASLFFLLPPLLLLAGPVRAEEMTLDGIPLPKAAERVSRQTASPEVIRARYRTPLPDGLSHDRVGDRVVEAAETFVEAMAEAGWKLRTENWQRRGAEFTFRKAILFDLAAAVQPVAKAMGGRMRSFVGYNLTLTRRVPFTDLRGREPVDVPRYPGSVRIRWMDLLGDFAVKYVVVADLDAVRRFFEERLPKAGWKPAKGVGTLNYLKGGVGEGAELPKGTNPRDPLDIAKKAIPSSLAVHLNEDEGIVEIGIGRSAGAPDAGQEIGGALTPPFVPRPPAEPGTGPLIAIDPEKDLPVYPGLERVARRRLPLGVQGDQTLRLAYEKKDAPITEALDCATFYLSEMATRGFEVADDEWYGIGRKLLFAKEAVLVRVNVKAVGTYPPPERAKPILLPVEVDVIQPLPSRDVAGSDIEGVERYPGSVRFYHLKVGMDHLVKYKAVATVAEAERHYIVTLSDGDWTFCGNDRTGLLFVPSDTAKSAADALASGQIVPTTLKVKVDDAGRGIVKIGIDRTRGD